jgi:hypothetical protein
MLSVIKGIEPRDQLEASRRYERRSNANHGQKQGTGASFSAAQVKQMNGDHKRGRCFPVSAAALRPTQARPASHHRSMARSTAACMEARWDRAPHEATRTRLSTAAILARLRDTIDATRRAVAVRLIHLGSQFVGTVHDAQSDLRSRPLPHRGQAIAAAFRTAFIMDLRCFGAFDAQMGASTTSGPGKAGLTRRGHRGLGSPCLFRMHALSWAGSPVESQGKVTFVGRKNTAFPAAGEVRS